MAGSVGDVATDGVRLRARTLFGVGQEGLTALDQPVVYHLELSVETFCCACSLWHEHEVVSQRSTDVGRVSLRTRRQDQGIGPWNGPPVGMPARPGNVPQPWTGPTYSPSEQENPLDLSTSGC